MKIAINGEIIDTEDILSIDKIQLNEHYKKKLYFDIKFINKNEFTYAQDINIEHTRCGNKYHMNDGNPPIEMTVSEFENTEKYQNALNKLSVFRDSIIKIWSENQSTIPQFNLE